MNSKPEERTNEWVFLCTFFTLLLHPPFQLLLLQIVPARFQNLEDEIVFIDRTPYDGFSFI